MEIARKNRHHTVFFHFIRQFLIRNLVKLGYETHTLQSRVNRKVSLSYEEHEKIHNKFDNYCFMKAQQAFNQSLSQTKLKEIRKDFRNECENCPHNQIDRCFFRPINLKKCENDSQRELEIERRNFLVSLADIYLRFGPRFISIDKRKQAKTAFLFIHHITLNQPLKKSEAA